MKPEIKAKWLEALRSGEYVQGQGTLRDGNKFCCLGVLCDIAAAEGVGKWKGERFLTGTYVANTFPPPAVQTWAGLDRDSPRVQPFNVTLSELNDTGMPFNEIADVIESEL